MSGFSWIWQKSRARAFVVIVLMFVVLTACSCSSDSGASADGIDSSGSSSGEASSDAASDAGSDLLQVDVPIPSEQTFFDVTAPPPHWPAFLGVPETLDTTQGFFLDQPTPRGRSLSATFVHAEGDTYGAEALAAIQSMGFEAILDNESGAGGRFVVLRRDEEEVQITIGPESTKISLIV